jgi:hypothetical protein
MKCVNCGFEWTDGRGNHDCGAVKDAFCHWVVIERDKLRVENTELQLTIAELKLANARLKQYGWL